MARIGQERVNRAALKRGVHAIDAVPGGQVSYDRVDACAVGAKSGGRILERRIVSGNDKIECVVCAKRGKLTAYSGRGTGDDGERASGHGVISVKVKVSGYDVRGPTLDRSGVDREFT